MSEKKVPILDIESAVKRIGGDRELYKEVAQIYIEDAPELIKKLSADLKIEDRSSIERNAHSLKSASANVGAELARAAALLLELEAYTADSLRLGQLLSGIERNVCEVIPLITAAISS